jgi:hypothetical protein
VLQQCGTALKNRRHANQADKQTSRHHANQARLKKHHRVRWLALKLCGAFKVEGLQCFSVHRGFICTGKLLCGAFKVEVLHIVLKFAKLQL